MNYAVIMAGGSGKRLWPLSRQKRPKQVLKLLGGETLLRKCFQRLEGIFQPENILLLTNANFVETVCEDLPELLTENIVAEPVMRDTSSAIGLAATILHKKDPDANMAVVTADQLLKPLESFQQVMRTALDFVQSNPEALLTFGIQPTFPSTQLGYIKFGKESFGDGVHKIEAFREKPNLETAKQYFKDSRFVWNSGLFVWKCQTILDNLKKFVPDGVGPLSKIRDAWGQSNQQAVLEEWFPKMPKISIDYAVMEKSKCVYGISLDCQWHDLGSFRALRDIIQSDAEGNTVISAHTTFLDSSNNIVVTEDDGHMLALIGVEDMIIANSSDATLVCPVEHANHLKELLEKISDNSGSQFL